MRDKSSRHRGERWASGSGRATWPSSPPRRRRAAPQRHGRDLRPGDLGLRPRHAGPADRRPDRVRAALPPARALGARPRRQPGLGRRPALRPRLPRTPLGPAPSGDHGPAARAGRTDRVPAARPAPAAVGGLLRRGSRGRPRRGAHQGPPGAGRRGQVVDLAQVLLDRTPRPARARRRRVAARAARPARPDCSWRRVRDSRGVAVHRARHGPRRRRLVVAGRGRDDPERRRRSSTRWPAGVPTRTPRSAARCRSSAASRPYVAASPSTAPYATPTAARSTTSSWRRSPAGCAAG